MASEAAAVRVRDALAEATAALTEAGCDAPRLDAELLLGEVLGVGRERLVLDAAENVDPVALERFGALVARRVAREPVAYILGRKEFRWITLQVDRRVLIPRPETELLVEVGLGLPHAARVVDVGTGSGAVALALKQERPDLYVVGTDASADAVAVARENAQRLGLDVRFVQADLLAGIEERFDAVLANLPYVPEEVPLAPEIGGYEPAVALFGGEDGLGLTRRLLEMVAGAELVALEMGFGQAGALFELLHGAGFSTVERLSDLAGHERAVVARR
jgi:release factor glutamine methyltransferase